MPRRSTKFYRKNEEKTMEMLGLTPTKNSGAGWIEKEDGYNDYILAQLKSTDAQSMSVKLLDLHKLEYHAAVEHKLPVFVVEFLETSELYLLVKPNDLTQVAQYLKTGQCNINPPIELIEPTESTIVNSKKAISSSARSKEKFWKEREAKWKK